MIERTFPIDNAEIEVTFEWDSGDPSVGISAGWGENTGIIIKAGPIHTGMIFTVTDRPVKEWVVDNVWTSYTAAAPVHLLDGDRDPEAPPITLESLPDICDAVEATWVQVQMRQAIERANDDVEEADLWFEGEPWITYTEQQGAVIDHAMFDRAQERLRLAKNKRDQLRAGYEHQYGVKVND